MRGKPFSEGSGSENLKPVLWKSRCHRKKLNEIICPAGYERTRTRGRAKGERPLIFIDCCKYFNCWGPAPQRSQETGREDYKKSDLGMRRDSREPLAGTKNGRGEVNVERVGVRCSAWKY